MVKQIWSKYSILICAILLVWGIYGNFYPKEVKTIEVRTIDTSWKKQMVELKKEFTSIITQLKQTIETQKNEIKNLATSIKEYDPNTGKLIKETTVIDKTEIKDMSKTDIKEDKKEIAKTDTDTKITDEGKLKEKTETIYDKSCLMLKLYVDK